MRQLFNVQHHRFSEDVLSECYLQFSRSHAVFRGLDDISKGHHLPLEVRHFNTDRGLPGDRGHDTYSGRRKGHGDIVRESHDPVYFYSRRDLHFIQRNNRAPVHVHHAGLNTEITECIHQKIRVSAHFIFPALNVGRSRGREIIRRDFIIA